MFLVKDPAETRSDGGSGSSNSFPQTTTISGDVGR
jgi:hypothetical protein